PQSVLRYPTLILMGEINDGDKVEITAVSTDAGIGSASAIATIKDNAGKTTLTFIPRGEIEVGYIESRVEDVVAILYDGRGILAGRSDFNENKASFANLASGDYTVVAMPAAGRLSGASTLDELKSLNLIEGKDYLEGKAKVENGVISIVTFDVIPEIDLTKFIYTDSETSVTVNKTSISVNGIVTVRGKVKFLPEYSNRIDKVKITFTIPEGCEYIENSLLTGGESNFTTIEEHTLSVDLPVKDASPRFCIRSLSGGSYRPSAVIEFRLDGRTIVQPIGSALFVANDFSISVPEKTSQPKITARGTATPQSDVRIYDNGVYMGSTHTQPNGDWRFSFTLFNPDRDDEHLIYAEISTKEGKVFRTSTGHTIYEKDWAELTDIVMMNGGLSICFNHIEATSKPGSYSYNPANDLFTFKTVFRDDKAEEIDRLIYVILLSDGSRREIEAKYLEGPGTWAAAVGFPNVDRLPVNVKALYTEKRKNGEDNLNLIDNVRDVFRCPDVIPVIDPSGYVYEAVPSNRLQGATATIYYKEFVEDMYGDVTEKAMKWDASEYAQENPQFTDEDGNYQWDVPQGEWQVRIEKEGYDTFTTEWLPVPPPQLDVNVGLVQTVAPEVVSVNAYDKGVEITFSKYMQTSSVAPGHVVVTADSKNVEGYVVALDTEVARDGSE
ncbi:MAG: hypothetical protein K2M10_05530, partial [Muribaculaceae bacterium]|nr:hypothetical protein [Muribaculaceae bacterium]